MIEFDESQFRRVQEVLQHLPDKIPQVMASAINRATGSARAEAVRQVREKYVIQAGRVRETIAIRQASTSNLFASVRSRGRPRALTYFKTNPNHPMGMPRGSQLFAQIKRGGGGTIRGAFIAKMRSGHLGVFNRSNNTTRNGNVELIQRYGPSVPQMLESHDIRKFIENKAIETLDKRLEHEINRILMR